MFYSTELLSLRGRGKLARVWLAAILGEEMFKKTCKAIMIKQIDVAAVCAEVSSVIEQRGRGNYVRLSLYLSSQLMFGATRILYYQTKYFQDSVINEIRNLHNRKRLRNADQEHPVSDFLFEVPEPPALALPFSRDKHLITEEPYPITSEHLVRKNHSL
ncbi:uncharacterized protein LOC108631972 [Ceratina calcarata]|uniref:Uncharacterized protein LOC108631972 n=1 Tax=Ceratina calcarata TaxID=156304 RepID=A0AAJ7NEV7_9HYME|nr:uncharacterized protein LOC108631972 [Ceratina calcarata]